MWLRPSMKTFAALLLYCLLFSVIFVILYPIYFDAERRVSGPLGEELGRRGGPAHVLSAVEHRQVLGVYEDSQSLSQKSSPNQPQCVRLQLIVISRCMHVVVVVIIAS